MASEKSQALFSKNWRPVWALGEGGCCGFLHKTLSFQAFHILEGMTFLVFPEWKKEVLFQAAGGKTAECDTEVIKCMVSEQYI